MDETIYFKDQHGRKQRKWHIELYIFEHQIVIPHCLTAAAVVDECKTRNNKPRESAVCKRCLSRAGAAARRDAKKLTVARGSATI